MSQPTTTKTAASAALQRLVITCAICAVVVGGVWLATAHPRKQAADKAALTEITAVNTYDTRLDNPNKIFTISVRDGHRVSGPDSLKVKQGDSVHIVVKALGDEEAQIHLDAFGIVSESAPSDNVPGGPLFIADKIGTYPYYSVDETGARISTLGSITITK